MSGNKINKAIFFDRDGVILKEKGLISQIEQVEFAEDVSEALGKIDKNIFRLIVVTNQAIVARGMISEEILGEIHEYLQMRCQQLTGVVFDDIYYCPHHPNANVDKYRLSCLCRKPLPGLLYQAADDWDIDLSASYLIGDRSSDIMAGCRAGCKTIKLERWREQETKIESDFHDDSLMPAWKCATLNEAIDYILLQEAQL